MLFITRSRSLVAGVVAVMAMLAAPAGFGRDTAALEKEVVQIEDRRRAGEFPPNPIVFVGSSSFRVWKSLAADLKGYPVANCGFGNSQMSDLNHFADRLVLAFKPSRIFVYEGDNDLNEGKSPDTVLADFKAFVSRVRRELPDTPITFVSVKPSPKRAAQLEEQREFNRMLRGFVATGKQLEFLDVFTPMLGPEGQPRAELFGPDNLHMNAEGYALWTRLILGHLKER